jgi:AcrR family transcriptional regulator
MARPLKANRNEILNETRDRLLVAAAAEFAREGYVGANINRISTAAGFAKGTIYNYFPSKRALMAILIDWTAVDHIHAIRQAVEEEDGPAARLEIFFRAGFDFVEQHPDRARVIINGVYGPDEDLKQHVYRAYQPLFDLLAHDVVARGTTTGAFRPVDPNVTTAMIMTIYLGSCSQLDTSGNIWLDPQQIVYFILDGLRHGDPCKDG